MTTEQTPPERPADAPPAPPVPVPVPVPPPAPGPARPTSTLAIVSLVCGIVGLVGWVIAPLIASVVAVVTGHMARAEIRRSGGAMDGDGLAIGGLVTGWLMIGLTLLTILVFALFLGGLAALLALIGLGSQV